MSPKYRPASTYVAGVEGDADAATGSALHVSADPTRRQGLDRADGMCSEHGTIHSNNVGLPLDEVEATGNRDLRAKVIVYGCSILAAYVCSFHI